jgi:hypothetical protein
VKEGKSNVEMLMRMRAVVAVTLLALAGAGAMILDRAQEASEDSDVIASHEDLQREIPGDPITPAERDEVLARLIGAIEQYYVMQDTARMITAHLRARDGAGAFDEIRDAAALAEILTREMQAVNGDRHLSVRPAAPPAAAGAGSGAGADVPDGPAAIGFTRVERLEGNVGYIELGGGLGRSGPGSGGDYALLGEVMREVDGTDAVILDLRKAPGGSAMLANLLVSHFLPPDVHVLSVESGFSGTTQSRYTAVTVPGPRRTDVPIFVLISSRTFSAAEDIAFSLQSQGRATVVGERTGGGGRNNMFVSLGHGLRVSISVTRVLDPRTGREAWERRGIFPDVPTAPEEALDVALGLARGAVAGSHARP